MKKQTRNTILAMAFLIAIIAVAVYAQTQTKTDSTIEVSKSAKSNLDSRKINNFSIENIYCSDNVCQFEWKIDFNKTSGMKTTSIFRIDDIDDNSTIIQKRDNEVTRIINEKFGDNSEKIKLSEGTITFKEIK